MTLAAEKDGAWNLRVPPQHLNNSRVVSKKLTTMTPVKILGAQVFPEPVPRPVRCLQHAGRRMVPPNIQYRRRAMLVRLESLILAQDERWRRA
jgi:hypothetical protein